MCAAGKQMTAAQKGGKQGKVKARTSNSRHKAAGERSGKTQYDSKRRVILTSISVVLYLFHVVGNEGGKESGSRLQIVCLSGSGKVWPLKGPFDDENQIRRRAIVYLEEVYFVTAFVPSETACLASSPGSRSRTAV